MPARDTSRERDGLSKRESRRAQRERTPAEMASELYTAGVSDGPTRSSRIRESSTGTTRARPSLPWESGGDPQGNERVEMGEPRGPSTAWPTGAAAVAVLIGSQRGGLGGDQALEDVWERAKLSQQQTRQSRRIGVQDDGEGAPGAPPCPPPTQRTERDQAVERRQSIRQGGSDSGSQGRQETERSYRSGGSPRGTGEDPQERHEAHRVKGGRDNDGVSPKFSSQGSRRVTLTLWAEGEDGEGS